ncbi:hypothetical protein ACOME3_002978 [Neoechinorhynchus agilis]
MPKEVIYNHSVAPWARSFQNDGIKRIDRVTYFGGILRVYLVNRAWLASLKDFASSNLPRDVYSVKSVTQKVQFLANGLQPNLNCEEKAEFEKLFNVKIKFFLNSRRSGKPISLAMVEGSRQVRDELCENTHSAFNCFEIRFTKNLAVIRMTIFFQSAIFVMAEAIGLNNVARTLLNVVSAWRQNTPLRIVQTNQLNVVQTAEVNIQFSIKVVQPSKTIGPGLKKDNSIIAHAVDLCVNQWSRGFLLPILCIRSSGINVSQSTVSSQLVTMEHLECRLEEVCNKLLTVMQALFTEAITTFEKKMCTLICNLPDIISSSFQFPRDLKQKRLNSSDTNPRSAKKSNITSNVTRSDSDDSIMELDETDFDFITRILNTQTALINNGTAALIPDAATRKL